MRLVFICLVLAVSGCTTQLKPESNVQRVFKTPVHGASVQVVAERAFQTLVIQQKPSFGTTWKAHTFVIPAGQPLMDSIVIQVKSIVPSARIGDRDDEMPATVTVSPKQLSLTFGVDEGSAVNLMAGFGVLAAGAKAEVRATATLMSEIVGFDGHLEQVTVVGNGSYSGAYLGLTQDTLSKTIGSALDDAAAKLVAVIEERLQQGAVEL